jgi:NAD(P)-dependent dehydrogenase (short-subunit alcohol dehydrogenase family)
MAREGADISIVYLPLEQSDAEAIINTAVSLTPYRIVNNSSILALRGSVNIIDYSATKGAIISFTRSLAAYLIPKVPG